jgi:hypothetical protein
MVWLRTQAYRLLFFSLLGYGFLYFSYKWLNPLEVNTDFTMYYPMFLHPLDFKAAPSPWVYRQLNAILVHCIWSLHIYFPERIMFGDNRYDQRIFFAALVANYVSVVVSAWLSTLIVECAMKEASQVVLLFAGSLNFFSFYLQETTLTGQSDGLSIALVALCYLLYESRQLRFFCVVVILSVLQREVLPLIFLSIAMTDFLSKRNDTVEQKRFVLGVCAASVAAMLSYWVIRRIIHAPGNEYQTNLRMQVHALLAFRPTVTYIFQVFLGQNLLFVLGLVSAILYQRVHRWVPRLLPLLIAAIVLLLVSIMTQIGSNAARMLTLLTPIIAVEITLSIVQLDKTRDVLQANSNDLR